MNFTTALTTDINLGSIAGSAISGAIVGGTFGAVGAVAGATYGTMTGAGTISNGCVNHISWVADSWILGKIK